MVRTGVEDFTNDPFQISTDFIGLASLMCACGLLLPFACYAVQNVLTRKQHEEGTEQPRISFEHRHFISGVSAALPGLTSAPLTQCGLDELLRGESCGIQHLKTEVIDDMIALNVAQVKKGKDGKLTTVRVDTVEQSIKLGGIMQSVDLTKYGIPSSIASTMDVASQLAVAAGLEAAWKAGLVSGHSCENPKDPKAWELPLALQEGTGIIFASSFPAIESVITEVTRFRDESTRYNAKRMLSHGSLANTDEVPENIRLAMETLSNFVNDGKSDRYTYDRKFLFKVLVHANAQLAQIMKARGPNTQVNAACAGTTHAVSLAEDMLRLKRAQRVIVIAGDNASSDTLMPWIGSGFRALGAASIGSDPCEVGVPFDTRRNGMVVGSGAVALVLEREHSYKLRMVDQPSQHRVPLCQLIATHIANSAYHGASLDSTHIADSLETFLLQIERQHNISRSEIARSGMYLSHETMTKASETVSCSSVELGALRRCFGDDDVAKILILNTKGMTGHAMGVSFEDVVAVEALLSGTAPPVPNLQFPDPCLGNLRFGRGGPHECRYALRFAAGFGSQVAFALYGLP
eukprot:c6907_g1_i1.p1 GENE.c6907_g1_i1~~c6907_g1_i1.p1  ORF type:complete len:576 (+),score=153.46 c6907_g1_i1:201-1928(+)